jgi:putative intracellular protease/amidase
MWKSIGIVVLGLCVLTGAFVAWFFSLIDRSGAGADLQSMMPQQLPYFDRRIAHQRGRILAVVTSETRMGETGKSTGYEHTELARAYYVFTVNGFDVDIASPQGGEPHAIIDDEDMGALDYAFLNDPEAQRKSTNTLPLADVAGDNYDAIFFVGGKGTMWDFPENGHLQSLVSDFDRHEKLIGGVCHGPAALVGVTLPDGTPYLQGKTVTAFSNEEELFLIPDAADVFPFLLEDRLRESGAAVITGQPYLENIVVTDGLVTGQNPWSVYATAEAMVAQLGFTPVPRTTTGDENTVDVLKRYHEAGKVAARESIDAFIAKDSALNRNLLIIHGLVAAMQWEIKSALELLVLAQHTKTFG